MFFGIYKHTINVDIQAMNYAVVKKNTKPSPSHRHVTEELEM
jgi:hypothetical protein